jgi:GH15 family glucan-1,4-alpha-glucosidase
MDLFKRSIDVIRENQAPSGAYVASPNFSTYRYCWFRDGAFIAYAMDRIGEHDSASRFHAWAARCILARTETVQRAVRRSARGLALSGEDILHTRYMLDGQDGRKEEWPNFQLDGFGTWLWALERHAWLTNQPLPEDWLKAAGLVAQYLEALWRTPCYDCWEEFPEHIHTYTLAAIFGGLRSMAALNGDSFRPTLQAIEDLILTQTIRSGRFVKAIGRDDVDASLIGLALPYQLLALDDARMVATVRAIEESLRCGGGVHRYPTDTYYGGGEWVQLTAWLGWFYAEAGQTRNARELLKWVEAQMGPDGSLPEQVPVNLNDPSGYEPWRQRWGEIASPLLWSHAKYLILKSALSQRSS